MINVCLLRYIEADEVQFMSRTVKLANHERRRRQGRNSGGFSIDNRQIAAEFCAIEQILVSFRVLHSFLTIRFYLRVCGIFQYNLDNHQKDSSGLCGIRVQKTMGFSKKNRPHNLALLSPVILRLSEIMIMFIQDCFDNLVYLME